MFSGQKFREPFDLSVGGTGTGIAVEVIRSHLPNSQGGFDDVHSTTVNFPASKNVEIYLCEDKQGNKMLLSSDDDNLSAAQSKVLMWSFLSNGVVAEDCRAAALGGGGGGQIALDLSSLNWVQVSSELTAEGEDPTIVWNDSPSAQLWDWARLQDGDIADKAALTANNGWMFPVRPPDGLPHLQYVELSTMQDVVGGGGGGGGCSCDLSVTPPGQLSNEYAKPVPVASWTKDNWTTRKDIYAPDFSDACTYFMLRQYLEAFAYIPQFNQTARGQIINCCFWYGRRWQTMSNVQVTEPGTWYLEVVNGTTGTPSFTIRRNSSVAMPPPKSLIDSLTDETTSIFPLWVIPNVEQTMTTGIPFDCRTALNLPFYSN